LPDLPKFKKDKPKTQREYPVNVHR